MPLQALPAAASAAGTIAAGAVTAVVFALGLLDFSVLTGHMAVHIVLMNLAAPLVAVFVVRNRAEIHPGALLWAAACAQVMSLWVWHAPSLEPFAHSSAGRAVVHGHLLLMAVLFWCVLLSVAERSPLQAIFALLLTGKLVCLLGALLTLSPRYLYSANAQALSLTDPLADQQLAGLLMIAACPLSYLVASVAIAARMLGLVGRASVATTTA